MSAAPQPPPYFDALLARIEADLADDASVGFGQHVHWGYWDDPSRATGRADDFAYAASRLSEIVLEVAELRNGLTIADVGCGFGGTVQAINSRQADCVLTGINIDPRQVARATSLCSPARGNRVQFVVGEAAELPLPDESQDVVLAVECVFHFDRRRFFDECRRVLRPGGRLVLTDFTPAGWAKAVVGLIGWWHRRSTRVTFGDIDITYSWGDYERLAARSSFHV